MLDSQSPTRQTIVVCRQTCVSNQERASHRHVKDILFKIKKGMLPAELLSRLGKPDAEYPNPDACGSEWTYEAVDGTVELMVGQNPYPAMGSIPMQLLMVASVTPTVKTMRSFVRRGERVNTLKRKIVMFSLGHSIMVPERSFVRKSHTYDWTWGGTDGSLMLWADPKEGRIVRFTFVKYPTLPPGHHVWSHQQ